MGIQGLQCPPSACETVYGPCSCPNGYLEDTYGCVCECQFQTSILTTTTTTIVY